MRFQIGDQVRQGSHVCTVTDVGNLLVEVKTTEGTSRMVCSWELEQYRPHARISAPMSPRNDVPRRPTIMVRSVEETKLAWALVDAAKSRLSIAERNFVFVAVGAGETFTAIRHLLGFIADKEIPLRPQLVQLCITWLDKYAFHEAQEDLRDLVEAFLKAQNAARVAVQVPTNRRLGVRTRSEPLAANRSSAPRPAPAQRRGKRCLSGGDAQR